MLRISVGATLRMESAYFLQRHAGMDLIYADCELVLDALHLGTEVRDAYRRLEGRGLTVRSCRTLLNWLQIQL